MCDPRVSSAARVVRFKRVLRRQTRGGRPPRYTLSLSLSLSLSRSLALSLSLSLALSLSHTHTLSLWVQASATGRQTTALLSLSISLSLSLSHTHAHAHTHTLSLSLSHTLWVQASATGRQTTALREDARQLILQVTGSGSYIYIYIYIYIYVFVYIYEIYWVPKNGLTPIGLRVGRERSEPGCSPLTQGLDPNAREIGILLPNNQRQHRAALRIVLVTVPLVGRSCEHFPNPNAKGFNPDGRA